LITSGLDQELQTARQITATNPKLRAVHSYFVYSHSGGHAIAKLYMQKTNLVGTDPDVEASRVRHDGPDGQTIWFGIFIV